MGVFSSFYQHLAGDASLSDRELKVIIEEIDKVIAIVDTEQGRIDPVAFKNRGHISGSSFGGGDRAPALAWHHERAHAVTADTLVGVKDDLVTFREACRRAKTTIVTADESVADDLQARTAAVSSIVAGSHTDEGGSAHAQAQHDHQDAVPTETPQGEPGTTTAGS